MSQSTSSLELEIEQESLMLREIQNEMAEKLERENMKVPTAEEQMEIDSRSVFVGNVDYKSTTEEIEKHFKGCGEIVRITIPKDKYTKNQKNFAFIEFKSAESLENAQAMNGSIFRERTIAVTAKRTNKPGMGFGAPRGRGRGMPGGRGMTGVIVKYVYVNGPSPRRGRGARFAPY